MAKRKQKAQSLIQLDNLEDDTYFRVSVNFFLIFQHFICFTDSLTFPEDLCQTLITQE